MGEPAYKRALREVQVPYTIDRETGEQKPVFKHVDVDEENRKEKEAAELAKKTVIVNLPIGANLEVATKVLNAITAAQKKGLNLSVPEDLELLMNALEIKKEVKPAEKKIPAKKPAKKVTKKKSKTATNG